MRDCVCDDDDDDDDDDDVLWQEIRCYNHYYVMFQCVCVYVHIYINIQYTILQYIFVCANHLFVPKITKICL